MKRSVAIILLFVLALGLAACGNGETRASNYEEAEKEVREFIQGRLDGVYLKRLQGEGIESVEFTIDNIVRETSGNSYYLVYVTYYLTSNEDFDPKDGNASFWIAKYIKGIFDDLSMSSTFHLSTGQSVDTMGASTRKEAKDGIYYSRCSFYIDGVCFLSVDEQREDAIAYREQIKKMAVSMNSGNSSTCKSCGRSYSDSGNIMSIARSGMCSTCYGNFKWAQAALGK